VKSAVLRVLESAALQIRNGSSQDRNGIHSHAMENLCCHTNSCVGVLFGGATSTGKIGCLVKGRVLANHRHHGSVNTSTTNAPIEVRTKGRDSLRCNLPLANGIKKLLSFQILRHQY